MCSLKLRNFGCITAQVNICPSVKLVHYFWMILSAGWDSDDQTLPRQVQPTWQIATLTSHCILDLVSRDKRLLKNSSMNYNVNYENSYTCFCLIVSTSDILIQFFISAKAGSPAGPWSRASEKPIAIEVHILRSDETNKILTTNILL